MWYLRLHKILFLYFLFYLQEFYRINLYSKTYVSILLPSNTLCIWISCNIGEERVYLHSNLTYDLPAYLFFCHWKQIVNFFTFLRWIRSPLSSKKENVKIYSKIFTNRIIRSSIKTCHHRFARSKFTKHKNTYSVVMYL